MEKRLKENGHMVIVLAEGAGQEIMAESMRTMNQQDASGNKLLLDVGLWISERIKVISNSFCMNATRAHLLQGFSCRHAYLYVIGPWKCK